jgi:protoporphyrin/coproporphyrin ferrochelatase
MGRTGVVLTNLGGPDTPDAIEPFLENLFSDPIILSVRPGFLRRFVARRIARSRAPKVAKDYARIGGASPLPRLTNDQAHGLEAALERRAEGRFAVAVAMRYWRPFTEEAVEVLLARGCDRFLHLPLYPQESRATTESSSLELRRVLAAKAPKAAFLEVRSWHDAPGYVRAVRATVDEGLAALAHEGARSPHVLFTAHGLPERFRKAGDPYVGQIEATRAAVCAGLGVPTHLSFQSRVGPVEWVRPYTDDTVKALGAQGVESLLMVPLGFVSDHFETLFEIDLLYVPLARAAGIVHVARAPSLNSRRDFLETLADLVETAVR